MQMSYLQFLIEHDAEIGAQNLATAIQQAGSRENIQNALTQSGARTINDFVTWARNHPNVRKIFQLWEKAKAATSVKEHWFTDSVGWVWEKILAPVLNWLGGSFMATVKAVFRPLMGGSTLQKITYVGILALMISLPIHAFITAPTIAAGAGAAAMAGSPLAIWGGIMWFGNEVLAPAIKAWEA